MSGRGPQDQPLTTHKKDEYGIGNRGAFYRVVVFFSSSVLLLSHKLIQITRIWRGNYHLPLNSWFFLLFFKVILWSITTPRPQSVRLKEQMNGFGYFLWCRRGDNAPHKGRFEYSSFFSGCLLLFLLLLFVLCNWYPFTPLLHFPDKTHSSYCRSSLIYYHNNKRPTAADSLQCILHPKLIEFDAPAGAAEGEEEEAQVSARTVSD